MRPLLFALLLALPLACTVDDDIVEGKHCYTGSSDPDKSCMSGYECRCNFGECLCVKKDSLRAAPPELASSARRSEVDPSLALLRRLGLTP